MSALSVAACLGLGALAGVVHYTAIARDATRFVSGHGGLLIILRRIGRFTISGGLFVMAARSGLPALIAATGSFVASRQWAIRRFGAMS